MRPAVRPLAVGDLIRDNDPRMAKNRGVCSVTMIGSSRCWVIDHSKNLQTLILVSRIHLDCKPRRSGWSRVTA